MTLVILAAGLGSRYGGMKQLDPMTEQGEFIIDFSVFDAIRAGFDRVVFIIKEENLELFRESIGKRIEKHIAVDYAFQHLEELPQGFVPPQGRTKPFGTAQAIYCVRDLVKDPFAVINADDFYGRDAFFRLARHLALPEKEIAEHCMIGYRLGNTLTDHGTVSRGYCTVDGDGMLQSVTELTKIKRTEDGAAYLSPDGKDWLPLSPDSIVSMNCWGFTPAFFTELERDLAAFLENGERDPMTSECYLPSAVDAQRKRGSCTVRVYPTDAVWQGVTYAEDKPTVKAAIRDLIARGEYPENLWNI